ncbi:unnamed protein product, partial [Didymodactylos carnosus]
VNWLYYRENRKSLKCILIEPAVATERLQSDNAIWLKVRNTIFFIARNRVKSILDLLWKLFFEIVENKPNTKGAYSDSEETEGDQPPVTHPAAPPKSETDGRKGSNKRKSDKTSGKENNPER